MLPHRRLRYISLRIHLICYFGHGLSNFNLALAILHYATIYACAFSQAQIIVVEVLDAFFETLFQHSIIHIRNSCNLVLRYICSVCRHFDGPDPSATL